MRPGVPRVDHAVPPSITKITLAATAGIALIAAGQSPMPPAMMARRWSVYTKLGDEAARLRQSRFESRSLSQSILPLSSGFREPARRGGNASFSGPLRQDPAVAFSPHPLVGKVLHDGSLGRRALRCRDRRNQTHYPKLVTAPKSPFSVDGGPPLEWLDRTVRTERYTDNGRNTAEHHDFNRCDALP